jgi:predicted metal-dependent phosphoesterase TrpH
MKADLHCHSYYSDGNHSPDFLLKRAAENGVTHLAITDHDCTTALEKPLGDYYGLQLISGIEVSCQWETQEIHLIGLGIDWKNAELKNILYKQQTARRSRCEAINQILETNGVEGLLDYLDALTSTTLTRSHIADFLVLSGHAKNKQKAFKQYLGKKGKAYVPFTWIPLSEAINAIHNAGGLTVLAHPGRYSLSKRKLEALVSYFSANEGDGMEVSYGGIDPLMQRYLEQLAKSASLSISMGSDFHNAESHWTDIGKFPTPSSAAIKNAIWNHPRWHF